MPKKREVVSVPVALPQEEEAPFKEVIVPEEELPPEEEEVLPEEEEVLPEEEEVPAEEEALPEEEEVPPEEEEALPEIKPKVPRPAPGTAVRGIKTSLCWLLPSYLFIRLLRYMILYYVVSKSLSYQRHVLTTYHTAFCVCPL